MPPTTTMSSAMLDRLRENLLATMEKKKVVTTMEKKKVDELIEFFRAGQRKRTSPGAPGHLNQRIQSRIAESIQAERAQLDAQSPARIATHLRECWRRTTLTGARRQASNIICTNIKSQRHINNAGRRQKELTNWNDEIARQLESATLKPGITIDIVKETLQPVINRLSPPIENWSVRFLLCSTGRCPRRCTKYKDIIIRRSPDDVRRANRWRYWQPEDYISFKQERAQGIDAVYMGRAHVAVSNLKVSSHPSCVENSSTTKATAVQSQDGYPANVKKSNKGYPGYNPRFEKMAAVRKGVNLAFKEANAGSTSKSKLARARRGDKQCPTRATAADRQWEQYVQHCNKLRHEVANHEQNTCDRDGEIIDGVLYRWKPGNVARTSMVPIEPYHNSFSPFSTSDGGSGADSAPPCNSTVTSCVHDRTQPKYLLTQEQREALILNKPRVVQLRIITATIHTLPKCKPTTTPVSSAGASQRPPTIAPVTTAVTPLTRTQAAPRQSSQTKAQLETAKRLREREERKRGKRVQEIHLSVMYGGDQPRSTTARSTPPPTKPAAVQSPYPETRPQYRERSQRTQNEAAAAAFLALVATAATVDSTRRTNEAAAHRAAGERKQALARERQCLIDAVEQHHRMTKHVGPSSIADSTCSTNATITPQVARELGLEDLGPSPLPIKDAGGGQTAALHKSRIQVNESTGETGGATVAPINQSLEGIGKYVDEGNVVVYHPHYNGVTVHRKEDIVIHYDRLPICTVGASPRASH